MKGGAIEFLTKPFRDQELLDAVEAGLARDRARRESDRTLGALRERFETLSSREREIMIRVTAGRLNKQIANDIGIAESTVKVHRTVRYPSSAAWLISSSWDQKSRKGSSLAHRSSLSVARRL